MTSAWSASAGRHEEGGKGEGGRRKDKAWEYGDSLVECSTATREMAMRKAGNQEKSIQQSSCLPVFLVSLI